MRIGISQEWNQETDTNKTPISETHIYIFIMSAYHNLHQHTPNSN